MRTVVATGFFDGVHLGHRLVLETLREEALSKGLEPVVVTFWPHPRTLFQRDAASLRLLTSQQEKLRLLEPYGRTEVLPFTREFASKTAREYISEVLAGRLGAEALVVGYDTRLGSDRLGPGEIATLCAQMGLGCSVCAELYSEEDSKAVSSTRIRSALERGDVEQAARMLGRSYSLEGPVVSGNQLGRTIGFPTANLKVREPLKAIPAPGVYASEVRLDGELYRGMTNIDRAGKVETNIFEFDEMIYGRDLEITFERRLRDEIKFSGLDALKEQLQRDRAELQG